jgi:hypothetical protein
MTGHVFHPGHHALHGVTVLLETTGGLIYIGRFDSEDEGGAHLLDVAVHDSHGSDLPKEDFIRRTLKFGVRVDQKHALIRRADIARIGPLSEVSA